MKIEIELNDLESLRKENQDLKKSNEELKLKLISLNEDELKKHAIGLSRSMFGSVMNRIFTELGFEDSICLSDIDFGELEHYLGKNWWCSEKINVVLGANITNQFRKAYLRIGIKTE